MPKPLIRNRKREQIGEPKCPLFFCWMNEIGLTEKLKAKDQMKWVKLANYIANKLGAKLILAVMSDVS